MGNKETGFHRFGLVVAGLVVCLALINILGGHWPFGMFVLAALLYGVLRGIGWALDGFNRDNRPK